MMNAPNPKRKGGGPHRHASKSDESGPEDAARPYSTAQLAKMDAGFGRAMAREGRRPTMVSVFDGRVCLGMILSRGAKGYEAFTADERSLGLFPTQADAANALSAAGAQ